MRVPGCRYALPYLSVETRRLLFSTHPFPFESGSLDLEFAISGSACLCVARAVAVLWFLKWILEIQTQALMFIQQVPYLLSYLHNH